VPSAHHRQAPDSAAHRVPTSDDGRSGAPPSRVPRRSGRPHRRPRSGGCGNAHRRGCCMAAAADACGWPAGSRACQRRQRARPPCLPARPARPRTTSSSRPPAGKRAKLEPQRPTRTGSADACSTHQVHIVAATCLGHGGEHGVRRHGERVAAQVARDGRQLGDVVGARTGRLRRQQRRPTGSDARRRESGGHDGAREMGCGQGRAWQRAKQTRSEHEAGRRAAHPLSSVAQARSPTQRSAAKTCLASVQRGEL
jgi:hypothetical protein